MRHCRGGGSASAPQSLLAKLGLRSRTTHLLVSARHVANTFTLLSVVACMSRHIVVAPFPAAPLLTDTRRSAVGSGTREDIVSILGHSAVSTCTWRSRLPWRSSLARKLVSGMHGSTCSDGSASTNGASWGRACGGLVVGCGNSSCVLSCAAPVVEYILLLPQCSRRQRLWWCTLRLRHQLTRCWFQH